MSNGSYYNHNSQISVASVKYGSGISGNEPIKLNKGKKNTSYKSGIKEWAPLPLDKINQSTAPNQVFSPSNFNDNDMADDVLNVPPQ